jgi:M6 family metalloprotease-like protein
MKRKTLIPVLVAVLLICSFFVCGNRKAAPDELLPIDQQVVRDQDSMTWNDYVPIPGIDWANPQLTPKRGFRIAVVAVDFPDQPFVITQPEHSDLFGNPQTAPVKREDVAHFYADFFMKPSAVNHGHTIRGYWMEQSWGSFGITEADAFGPYRMPKELWKYGLNEWGQNAATPDGSTAHAWMEEDIDSIWKADKGDIIKDYDAVLRIYAGYDETGIWMEFGEMKFLSKDDIPAEWGNPNPEKPRWAPTRYVPWTSWKAGQMQWGLSSMRQGENSGTITHELGHFAFNIGDNNNNPYVKPYRRAGSGPWDMMDRGCFNGPGGPHKRWLVPAVGGAAMPAGLMLRNRIKNGFISRDQVLTLSRDDLASTGLAVAHVTARAVRPKTGEYAGVIVNLDGKEPHDRIPADDPATNPLSPGIPNFDFYSMEVVQRIGYDSYCPDNGVLIAMNKDRESTNGGVNGFNCFNWVIDAHPEDINMIDYVKPDGTKVMRTVADYRQLNDALFHAGLNSGSSYEYTDESNRLHFYIIDLDRDSSGVLSYTLGVKSLENNEARKRGMSVEALPQSSEDKTEHVVKVALTNNTATEAPGKLTCNDYDIYRISVSVNGKGWKAMVLNELVAVACGQKKDFSAYYLADKNADSRAEVTVKIVSESNPALSSVCTFTVKR